MVEIGNAQSSGMITNNTSKSYHQGGFFMPKNKFQDVVFTAIMATVMVYGMVVYNVALNMGKVTGATFLAAVHELPVMVPVAFILEFFVVGRIARGLAFTYKVSLFNDCLFIFIITTCCKVYSQHDH